MMQLQPRRMPLLIRLPRFAIAAAMLLLPLWSTAGFAETYPLTKSIPSQNGQTANYETVRFGDILNLHVAADAGCTILTGRPSGGLWTGDVADFTATIPPQCAAVHQGFFTGTYSCTGGGGGGGGETPTWNLSAVSSTISAHFVETPSFICPGAELPVKIQVDPDTIPFGAEILLVVIHQPDPPGGGQVRIVEAGGDGTSMHLSPGETIVHVQGIVPSKVNDDVELQIKVDGVICDSQKLTVGNFRVVELTYNGTKLHRVLQDNGTAYLSPHWGDNSTPYDGDAADAGDRRIPICSERAGRIWFAPQTIKFAACGPIEVPDPSGIRIRGSGSMGSTGFTVGPAHGTVSGGKIVNRERVAVTGTLPNSITFLNPLQIKWELSFDRGATWQPAGATDNRFYIILDKPVVGAQLFETVLEIGCRNGEPSADPDNAVSRISLDFIVVGGQAAPEGVKRKALDGLNVPDGVEMKYYDPARLPNMQGGCETVEGMLSHPDGIGTCAAWANLFIGVLKAQGISGATRIRVTAREDSIADPVYFLVKNWEFTPEGTAPPECTPYTHRYNPYGTLLPGVTREVTDKLGVPGQGNPDPSADFLVHFIVQYKTLYYDPSYGRMGIADQLTWEKGAVDGYRRLCTPSIGPDVDVARKDIFNIVETKFMND